MMIIHESLILMSLGFTLKWFPFTFILSTYLSVFSSSHSHSLSLLLFITIIWINVSIFMYTDQYPVNQFLLLFLLLSLSSFTFFYIFLILIFFSFCYFHLFSITGNKTMGLSLWNRKNRVKRLLMIFCCLRFHPLPLLLFLSPSNWFLINLEFIIGMVKFCLLVVTGVAYAYVWRV